MLWLAGCECGEPAHLHGRPHETEHEDEGEGEVEREVEDEVETETETETDACTLGAARVLGHEGALHALAIASTEDGAPLVLAEHDATHVDAFLVAGDAAPAPVLLELPDASALFALEAAAPAHFVALTLGTCTTDGHASPCVHALGIDTSEGHIALHGTRTVLLPAPLRSSRVLAASDSLYFAHAHQHAGPVLDRIGFGADDLSVVSQPLGQGDPALEVEPTEILGMTASGGGYAVLWRRGASEDAASAVVLTTQLDEHQVSALHDALVVESMAWLAGSLSIVVSLEFARPSYVRLGADGEMRGPAMTLRFGEEPPAPFGGRRVALVRGGPGTLSIQVRDGAGDEVGEAIALDPTAQRADTARSEHGFHVVTADGTEGARTLTLHEITCP
jgi:hypothetical protein